MLFVYFSLMIGFGLVLAAMQSPSERKRIIAFGAHPDDCELMAGGVAARWAAEGHAVKFVSTTNGDIGHFAMAGGPLALRRRAEVQRAAEILGIETEVLDIHDGELLPTLENRRTIVRLIREWKADVVLFHRPWDYHPDHRYTGVLVQDAAVTVAAAYFLPYTPALKRNPVFLYMYDGFEKPYPFQPDIVVGIDDVADKKWACIRAMPSQFADRDSWMGRYLPGVPEEEEARAEFILNFFRQENEKITNKYRDRLIEMYGEEKGRSYTYAEAFELCEYGTQPDKEELRRLFMV
ncbi:MAG: PIG-L deacetylase family protein [Bacteroidota bacterium]